MPKNDNNIQAALRDARDGDGDAVLSRVDPATLGNSRDERWLTAEHAYLRGDYAQAQKLFESWDADSGPGRAPRWQRSAAAHRLAVVALHESDLVTVMHYRNELQRRAEPGPRSRHGTTLLALDAHIAERQREFEMARTKFQAAYASAVAQQSPRQAATAASDVGRILGILGRPQEGLVWLERARDAHARAPRALVGRTIRLREAMLKTTLGRSDEALDDVNAVLEACQDGRTPRLPIDALGRRADLYRIAGKLDLAENDLLIALARSEEVQYRFGAVFLRKDLAMLHLEQGREADACRVFSDALRHALDLRPPQALTLMQLADDVVAAPQLVGRTALPAHARDELTRVRRELEELDRPSIYQRGTRARRKAELARALAGLLNRVQGDMIKLASCDVFVGLGQVVRGSERTSIDPAQIAVLRVLIRAPVPGLTPFELARELDLTLPAAEKRLSRLRRSVGRDLVVTRDGNRRRYQVRTHAG